MGVLYVRVSGQWVPCQVSGGGVQQVVAGAGVAVNSTDPTKPIVALALANLGKLVTGAVLGTTVPTGGTITRMTQDMLLPGTGATTWLVIYHVMLSSNAAMTFTLRMYGVVSPGYQDHSVPGVGVASATHVGLALPGASVAVYGINGGTQPVASYADGANNILFAIGLQ